MAARPRLPVFPGRNVWQLIRGNVDEPDPERLPQMAAAFVRFALTGSTGPTAELIPVGEREWRFDGARPFRVLFVKVQSASSPMPPGKLMGDRSKLQTDVAPSTRVLKGTDPFFIGVEFWWRGEPTKTIEFPAWQKGFLGPTYSLTGADWLLDKAVFDDEADDPGAETWGDAQGDRATDLASKIPKAIGDMFGTVAAVQGIALLVALWLFLKKD